MPLPDFILDEFQSINPETPVESDYYGAYTLLLSHVFPALDGYVVHPQLAPVRGQRDAVDFVIFFRVSRHRAAVFFVEVKTAIAINQQYQRIEADIQMRLRQGQLYDQSPSELHGISALGPMLCFYCVDKNTGVRSPPKIAGIEDVVIDTAPASRWDTNILTDDGYNRFMDIVERVRRLAHEVSQA